MAVGGNTAYAGIADLPPDRGTTQGVRRGFWEEGGRVGPSQRQSRRHFSFSESERSKFHLRPDLADPDGIINQGHGNATAKAVQIYRGDAINRAALLAMFRAVIANNRAGGWRRMQA